MLVSVRRIIALWTLTAVSAAGQGYVWWEAEDAVREIAGRIRFHRADAPRWRIQPLDPLGYPTATPLAGPDLTLRPNTIYYHLTAP